MKKKLKLFKFITNIVGFFSLTLSVFGPLWHFQNTKSYSDFKLETRDIDLLNSKKPLNFDDLVQIVSAKNQQNSLVINANIKKTQTHLNKTSTHSETPNLDDIKIQINQDGQVILNSASLEFVNKKAELYFEKGIPKLKFEDHVFDFRELQNQTRVEKTFFFLLPFIPFITKAVAAAIAAVAATTATIAAVKTVPKVVDSLRRWIDNGRSEYSPVDYSPIISRTESSIVVDLEKLPKEKGESSIKTKAKATTLKLSIVKDKEKLKNTRESILLDFLIFRLKNLKPYFVISQEEISATQAWILAVGSLLAQSVLTQIVIDNLLPSLIKDKMNQNDRDYIREKLNSPIDFYSHNELVMWALAEKTKDTANLILGNQRLTDPNNNLNKDIGFTKDRFVVGEGLANDAIDWTNPKNEFDIQPSKAQNNQSYVKIYFPSYHVRRLRMIRDNKRGIKREFIKREKC
ncbi:hypothetical protein [Mesomycoplasma hyopneumoniae]|uniref:hypothetical protein n=1 Tax=Mesomycoplasma hyopneumoniae TaxID=2099 RepID=UPI0038783D01